MTTPPSPRALPPADDPGTIQLVLAADRNLVRQAGITALSARLRSSLPIHVTFLTPQRDVALPAWLSVLAALRSEGLSCDLLAVDVQLLDLQVAEHLTLTTYYRLLTPSLLAPGTSRAIYLDCDVLVGRDLAALWTTSLDGQPIGAVPDHNFTSWDRIGLSPSDGYFNAGVLLLDIPQIRRDRMFEEALQFSQEHPERLTWSDQCALNATLARRWRALGSEWNFQYADLLAEVRSKGLHAAVAKARSSVMHFNNYDRPWLPESAHPLRDTYFAVAQRHSALDLAVTQSVAARWIRLKRRVKWRLMSAGMA